MTEKSQLAEKAREKADLKSDSEEPSRLSSWEAELATRIGAIADHLGKDASVQVTGKSWKQIQRYAKGDEPPLTVVSGLATAARVSLPYLIEGIIQVSADARIQRNILDKKISVLSKQMKETGDEKEKSTLMAERDSLLERAGFLSKLEAALLNKRRYPRSYQDLIEGKDDRSLGSLDPEVVREIQEFMGVNPAGLAEGQAPFGDGVVPLDEELMRVLIQIALESDKASAMTPGETAELIIEAYRGSRAVGIHPSDTHGGEKTG